MPSLPDSANLPDSIVSADYSFRRLPSAIADEQKVCVRHNFISFKIFNNILFFLKLILKIKNLFILNNDNNFLFYNNLINLLSYNKKIFY